MGQHWSHLTPTKRIQLDAFIRAGMKPTDIAKELGKGGIVRDATLYGDVERRLRQCARDNGFVVRGWLDSPITGGDGNREFFIWLNK